MTLLHKLRSLLFVLIIISVAGWIASAQVQPVKEEPLPVGSAVVGDVKGTVVVRSPQGESISFERGQLLSPGSTIETAKGSIVLDLQDGSQVLVKSNTRVVLKSPADGNGRYLELFIGKIWNKVQKRLGSAPSFRMGTPTAVITVRGTELSVEVTKKNVTIVNVLEGLVEVAALGAEDRPVLVKPGFATEVQPGHLPATPRQSVPTMTNPQIGVRGDQPTFTRPGGEPGDGAPGTQTMPGRQSGEQESRPSSSPPQPPPTREPD